MNSPSPVPPSKSIVLPAGFIAATVVFYFVALVLSNGATVTLSEVAPQFPIILIAIVTTLWLTLFVRYYLVLMEHTRFKQYITDRVYITLQILNGVVFAVNLIVALLARYVIEGEATWKTIVLAVVGAIVTGAVSVVTGQLFLGRQSTPTPSKTHNK